MPKSLDRSSVSRTAFATRKRRDALYFTLWNSLAEIPCDPVEQRREIAGLALARGGSFLELLGTRVPDIRMEPQ